MTQETILTLVIVGVAALLIGFFIGKNVSDPASDDSALEKAQKELEDYKASVSEHFGKTADLVDNLTNSYKEVFDHLGNSARTLMTEEEVNRHLKSRADKAVTLTYITETVIDKASENNHSENNNPMEQAQTEIRTESVVDKAKGEAEKMAQSMSDGDEAETETETETVASDNTQNTTKS